MRQFLMTLFLIINGVAHAQTTISGVVTDEAGEAIPGANVLLANTYDGTSTQLDGSFTFTSDESGLHTLIVRFVGFKEFATTLTLEGKAITLRVQLKEAINQLEAVTISAGSFSASDESRRTIFKAIDIATTAGATADIAGALNTLPGTQKVGESGRLFVRGGDGTEARTFIDGTMILDAYSPAAPNTPSRGRFLPFMFKGTSFSTGGYSAEYGQALSAALVLDSKDESEITRTDIGILSVGADVTHTQAWERGSIAGKIQYTNIRPYFGLINQEIDWDKAPASVEGISAFRQRMGKSGMVKIFSNFSSSDFSLYQHDIDDPTQRIHVALKNNFGYMNAFYKQALNEKWVLRGGVSYTTINNKIVTDEANTLEDDKGYHIKAVAAGSLSDRVEVKTGIEVLHQDYQFTVTPSGLNSAVHAFDETITAAFAEADVYTSNRFIVRGGLRTEFNTLQNNAAVDPRLSLAYKTGNSSQVALAYGTFRQSVRAQYLRDDHSLKSEKASHYILSYQTILNDRTFRIETYYKDYTNLVKFENGNPANRTNDGSGYAKGIELFWRDNRSIKNVDYWISYSYLDTERNYLDFPIEAVPAFASRHNFSAVYKHFIPDIKSQVGFTWSYTSGRPYFNPNSDAFHSDRTPAYQDLSFNLSYLPKPYIILYFSCTNVLGRDNVFGYEFGDVQNSEGEFARRAIRQPAPRFIFLGLFITFSKNKSMNQLPSL